MKLTMMPGPKMPVVLVWGAAKKADALKAVKGMLGGRSEVVFLNPGVEARYLDPKVLADAGTKRVDGTAKPIVLMSGMSMRATALKQLERIYDEKHADLRLVKKMPIIEELTDEQLALVGLVRMTDEERASYLVAKLGREKAENNEGDPIGGDCVPAPEQSGDDATKQG